MNLNFAMRLVARWLCALAIVFSSLAFNAFAGEEKSAPFSGYVKFDKYHADFDVNPDGTFTVVRDSVLEVLSEEGIKIANHTGFSYSESLAEAQILSASTLKKDGRRIEVPAANIQDREGVAAGGPMFSDIKNKTVIFPDVAVGDKVELSEKIVWKTPLYPGHFFMTEAFNRFVIYDDVRIRVSVPLNSLDLKVLAEGVQGGRTKDKNGRAEWIWTFENHQLATPEVGAVDSIDYGPKIIVSSLKDYGDLAAAYNERAEPKAAVTDKIRSLAAELTSGVADPRERAKILYTWVVKNIHFAGNYSGIGSVVPHDAEMVLANRLGDCKDCTTLFQSLLAAVGIESTPVMINAGNSYKLPQVTSPGSLNHVITYIPSLDLYADPSVKYTPFGMLPPGEYGKPAVPTCNYTGLRQTPLINYEGQNSTMKMVLHIHEDGSADGESKIEDTGLASIKSRAIMANIQPNMEDLAVRSLLQKRGYTGSGALTKDDPKELSDQYTYGLKFHLNNAANLPGPGALNVSPIIPGVLSVSDYVSGLNLPEKKLDCACMGDTSVEEYTFDFPKNIKISSLPKDVHLKGHTVSYDSTYRRDGNAVTVVRRVEDRTKGPVCTPEDDREFRPIARDILKDLKTQLIYEPADGN